MPEINVDGMEELMQRLKQMGDKTGKIENNAIKKAASIVQESASRKAPRSLKISKNNYGRGHLSDNIGISSVKNKEGYRYVEVGPQKADRSPYYYGKFLEWGTSKMKARPFMQPAYEENKKEILDTIKEELKGGLGI